MFTRFSAGGSATPISLASWLGCLEAIVLTVSRVVSCVWMGPVTSRGGRVTSL